MTNSATYLTTLHKLLDQHFNLAEIQTLCFKLNIDYERVPGEEKQSKIRELLLFLARRDHLPELITLLEKERPDVEWPPVPDDFQLPESFAGETAISDSASRMADTIVNGDMINVGNISNSSGIAIGRGATAVNINTGDNFYGDIQKLLANYIADKQTEWEKPETTTHHIHLAARISSSSLRQEIEKTLTSWTSIADIEQALDEFNGCFVVLGEPGSGKSTLLRKLAQRVTIRYNENPDKYLPVWLDLNQWTKPPEFELFLKEQLYREIEHYKPESYRDMFLFLDGLNEMSGDVEAKVKSLDDFLKKYNVRAESNHGLRIIVSCRYHAYAESLSLDLPRVVIEPLSEEQIKKYLRTRNCEPLIPFLFKKDSVDNQIALLAKRPLFLNFLVNLYKNNDFKPTDSVHQNYGLILDKYTAYLWQREKDRNLGYYASDVPEFSDVKPMLMQLAFDIQVRDAGATISTQLALQSFLQINNKSSKVMDVLKKITTQTAQTKQNAEFLLSLSKNASILRIDQDGTAVQFQYELLQEYFVACYLHTTWQKNRSSRSNNNEIYQYLGNTYLSFDKRHREQQHWDEVWFIFANLCNSVDLNNFIQEISDKSPFFAAEIASRTNPNPDYLRPLVKKLLQYATAEKKCDEQWINCQEVALYALGNFNHTEAEPIIKAFVGLMGDYRLDRVGRPLVWQIGQRIGIPSLLKIMNDCSEDGDETVWGLFIHQDTSGESLFKFEFFKLEWLFDREMYDKHLAGWVRINYVTETCVADVQDVVALLEQYPPVSHTVIPYISDRAIFDVCLRILPTTPALERIISIILAHPTLTGDDILNLLQHEHSNVPEATVIGILNSQHGRMPVKRELFNQPDVAFCLIKLWHSASGVGQEWMWQDSKRKYYRQLLKILEPTYSLPALSKFIQQTDISTLETEEIFDLIKLVVKTHPFSYEDRYKGISDWLLNTLTESPLKTERIHVLAVRTLILIKTPIAIPTFINLATQNWVDCIDVLTEVDLGEYKREAIKALQVAVEKYESERAAHALRKLQVSDTNSALVNFKNEVNQSVRADKRDAPLNKLLALSHLSQELEDYRMVEDIKETFENVLLTHESIRPFKSTVQTINALPPDTAIIVILTELLRGFCIEVNKDGQYSYLHWSALESNNLAEAINKTISLFEQVNHLDNQISDILVNTTTLLLDIVKHRNSLPQLGFDKTLIVAIQLLGKKQIETAVPVLRNILNDPSFTFMNIWETAIPALGQIGTEQAIIALCDVFKNRKTVYPEWDHDTLSGLATKVIIDLEEKSAFDIFFNSLPEITRHRVGNDIWLQARFGRIGELRAIKSEKTLEYLIQAWIDIHSSKLQNYIADRYLADMPDCTPFIIQYAIPNPQHEIRRYALNVLNNFEIGQATDGISMLCEDEQIEIRQLAVWMLADRLDIRAVNGLASMIQHPSQINAEEWNESMWWIRPLTDGYMLRYSKEVSKDISTFLSKKIIRQEATNLLIKIESPKVVDVLKSLSNDNDAKVRYWGKYGLAKIEEKRKQAP